MVDQVHPSRGIRAQVIREVLPLLGAAQRRRGVARINESVNETARLIARSRRI